MPHAWTIGTPKRSSKPRMSDSGTAEPPQTISFSEDRSGFGSRRIMPCQIVGTPAVNVTCSDAMSSARSAGVIRGPGMTSRAPVFVEMYGRPHALTWNIGTTGITESVWLIPRPSDWLAPSAWRTVERCEYRTPFGFPVVPLV